jgi:hypothetical protein
VMVTGIGAASFFSSEGRRDVIMLSLSW